MIDIPISSEELKSKNSINLPAKASDFSSYTFWYYTSLETANLILQSECIHVSNIGKMNDLDEIKNHKSDKDFVHCLCFCNSNTEKIPMWYLYAGITGKGISIGLTPATMMTFLKSLDKVYTIDGKTEFTKGKDFDIDFGWVYYRKNEQHSQVIFKRKWYSLSDPDNFDLDNYYIKSYPWEYEKEFRIVFRNKTGVSYDKIAIKITDIYSKIKLRLGPELKAQTFEKILPSLSGFVKYSSTIPSHSKLGINMNLCQRNIKGFVDYLDTDLKKNESEREMKAKDVNRIYDIVRKAATGIKDDIKE